MLKYLQRNLLKINKGDGIMPKQVVLEMWGDYALFARPEGKIERLTYPVPTPSAMRGALSAIYSKPVEFYWQIKRIEVLNPINYITVKRNEVKCKVNKKPILVEDERTQRNSVMLKDVHYRIFADIIKRDSFNGSEEQLYSQAMRRIKNGKCFYQPCFGTRECVAYFGESDGVKKPVQENIDLGYILYDVFDLHSFDSSSKTKPFISVFHAVLEDGVLNVPDFDSHLVLKPGR